MINPHRRPTRQSNLNPGLTQRGVFKHARQAGLTLIELVITLVVVGILAAMVTPSVTAYLSASSKKTCVSNQSSVQTAMRSYAGLNNIAVGANLVNTAFLGTTATSLMPVPKCSAGTAAYTFGAVVPAIGVRYATCGVDATGHIPDDFTTW